MHNTEHFSWIKDIKGIVMKDKYILAIVCGLMLAGCQHESKDNESLCGTEICSETQVCEADHCVNLSCLAPATLCPDNHCYDLSRDDLHCGKCDTICGDYNSCISGKCEFDESKCVLPNIVCDEQCINPMTSEEYCGNCGTKCNSEQICDGGRCIYQCEKPKTACSDGCFDLDNDTKNCHECGHDCNEGVDPDGVQYVCVKGECVTDCEDNELVCGGNCTNPKTSVEYCGAKDDCEGDNAGKKCITGAECKNGKCICGEKGDVVCKIGDEMKCANPKSDSNCGCDSENAGLVCTDLTGISEGHCTEDAKCEFTCEENRMDCNNNVSDGCEADLTTPEYCGSCTHACNRENALSVACVDGDCELTCKPGTTLCASKCSDLLTDNDNCGWCGNPCLGDSTCQNGFCVVDASKCKDGYVDDVSVMDPNNIEVHVKAYCIESKNDLVKIREHLREKKMPYPDLNKNPDNAYILMKNISFSEEEVWDPIGHETAFVSGYFLGNGKRITGGLVNTGLFDIVENSVFDGLDLGLNIIYSKNKSAKTDNTGIIASRVNGDTVFRHIKSDGIVQCYSKSCGGLVGVDQGGTNVYSMIDIKGRLDVPAKSNQIPEIQYVGGLVGKSSPYRMDYISIDAEIVNHRESVFYEGLMVGGIDDEKVTDSSCSSVSEDMRIFSSHVKGKMSFAGDVSFDSGVRYKSDGVGGMIGYINNSKCGLWVEYSSADVENIMLGNNMGGVFGEMQLLRADQVIVDHVSSKGRISCRGECGGLIGSIYYSSATPVDDPVIRFSNSVSEVNITIDPDAYNSTDIGGFIGRAYNAGFENCESHGDVEISKGSLIGGFAGLSYNSQFDRCLSDGNVTIPSSESAGDGIGGFVGALFTSVINYSVAKGFVKNDTGKGTSGGFAGNMTSGTVNHCLAYGNVEGFNNLGSFIGVMVSGSVSNSMSFGNVTGKGTSDSVGFIGGAIGLSSSKLDFTNLVNYGNVTGSGVVAGFLGGAGPGNYNLTNIIIGSKISGSGKVGYLSGDLSQDKELGLSQMSLANIYYWQDGLSEGNILGVSNYNGTSAIDLTKVYSFSYNDKKEPVLLDESKLMFHLSTETWSESACMLKSGVGTDKPDNYIVPVLSLTGIDVCK